jgi:hypothetical protein
MIVLELEHKSVESQLHFYELHVRWSVECILLLESESKGI